MKKFFFVVLMVILLNPGIDAQNSYLITSDSLNTSIPVSGIYSAFEVINNLLIALEGDTIYEIDLATATTIQKFGLPDENYNGFPSFISVAKNGTDYWVGYTTGDNSDDRIYLVDSKTGTWDHKASMPGNFDLSFWKGQPFVSGLNSSNWADPNGIWALDLSGENKHQLIVATGGYSAGIDIDKNGNLYFGTSFFSDNALLKWNTTDIQSILTNADDTLSIDDALKLTDLPAGTYDIDLDIAGNLVFSNNNFVENFIGKWDGKDGFDTLATSEFFLTRITTQGNINMKNPLNQVFTLAYGADIAEIHHDIPPVVSSPLADFSFPLDQTESIEYDLYDVFHDDDDHDTIFIYSIIENSNPTILSGIIEGHLLIFDIIGSSPGKVDIIIEGKTNVFSVCDTLQVSVIYPLGAGESDIEDVVLVYPNPASEYLMIKSAVKDNNIVLRDMQGRIVLMKGNLDADAAIDISGLVTGSYFLQMKNEILEYHTIILIK